MSHSAGPHMCFLKMLISEELPENNFIGKKRFEKGAKIKCINIRRQLPFNMILILQVEIKVAFYDFCKIKDLLHVKKY